MEPEFTQAGLNYDHWDSAGFDTPTEAKQWDDAMKTVSSNGSFNDPKRGEKVRANYAKRWRDAGYSLDEAKPFLERGEFEPKAKPTKPT